MSKLIEQLQSTVMDRQSMTAIAGDESLTFSQLWSQTDAFAGGLRDRDVGAGERIGIRIAEPRAFLIAVFGTLRNGCVPVTMPLEYDERTVATALEEAGATAVVTDLKRLPSILVGADSVRLGVRVGDGTGMGVAFESFLDNSGMNSTGTRSGIDIVRRADEDLGLIAYLGRLEREPLAITYPQSSLIAAARAGGGELVSTSHADATDSESTSERPGQIGALSLANPLELLFGATATLVQGDQYQPLEEWDPDTVRSLRYTTAMQRVFVTPAQYESLRAVAGTESDGTNTPADGDSMVGVAVLESAGEMTAIDGGSVSLVGTPETGLTHVRTAADIDAGRLGQSLPDVQTTVHRDGADSETTRETATDNTPQATDSTAHTPGELAVTGPATMDGYLERPALTDRTVLTAAGTRWIRTGARATTAEGTVVLEEESVGTVTLTSSSP